jgi:crossover junction endodeoxyribonuclease RuvC
MLIFSIDPSLSSTGYAIIDGECKKLIDKGKINTTNKYSTDDRIQMILAELMKKVPEECYIMLEDGYVGVNSQSSLKLSELRGAIIFFFKYNGYDVIHQQPKEIRKNFGLKGNAKKEEVAKEVLKYYPKLETDIGSYSDRANKKKTSDIYDAISIGLSFILQQEKEN